MKAVFVELPAFERYRSDYLDDNAFGDLQAFLMSNPEAARANAAVFGSFITGGAWHAILALHAVQQG